LIILKEIWNDAGERAANPAITEILDMLRKSSKAPWLK